MAADQLVSIDVLRQLLRLDPETGKLYWLPREPSHFPDAALFTPTSNAQRYNTRRAGKEAMTGISDTGYYRGYIFKRTYKAHRVVFALFHGRWPSGLVDHIDGNKLNNRPSNLREANFAENAWNTLPTEGRTSAYKGVFWDVGNRKWRASCRMGGKRKCLGRFSDEEEAARAYDAYARSVGGDFARLNFPCSQ